MKKVSVIAKYEAYVPDDMSVSQIQDLAEERFREHMDCFTLYIENYPSEEHQCPMFGLDDVLVGTKSLIAVGGD